MRWQQRSRERIREQRASTGEQQESRGEHGTAPREHTGTIVVSAGAERRSRGACLSSIELAGFAVL